MSGLCDRAERPEGTIPRSRLNRRRIELSLVVVSSVREHELLESIVHERSDIVRPVPESKVILPSQTG